MKARRATLGAIAAIAVGLAFALRHPDGKPGSPALPPKTEHPRTPPPATVSTPAGPTRTPEAWASEFKRRHRAGATREELAALVDRIAAEDPRGNAPYEEFAEELAKDSLPDALAWLRAMPPSEGRNYALGTMAATWAKSDPKAAMEWAQGLETEDDRTGAMQRVFSRWCDSDASAATQWLGDHESDPSADRLIVDFIANSTLFESNPRLSAQWAAALSDPGLRARTLSTALAQWSRLDPDAAADFIRSTPGLPPGLDSGPPPATP